MNNNLNTDEIHELFSTNCLALTIRKDYRSTVVSHIVSTAKRVSFKLLFNVGLLNLLAIIF